MPDKLIRKYFSCLYQTHSFTLGSLNRFPNFGNWAIVLLSDSCRILFSQDRGELSMAFGPLGLSQTWDGTPRITWNSGPWYDVAFILAYLDLNKSLLTKHAFPEELSEQAENIAEKTIPHISKICELFYEDRFWREKDQLDDFCHNIIEEQWDSLSNTDVSSD